MKAAIDAHVSQLLNALEKDVKARLKAVDAECEQLSVAASQLAAASAMCRHAIAASSRCEMGTTALARICESASRSLRLAAPFTGLRTDTYVNYAVSEAPFHAALRSVFREEPRIASCEVISGSQWCFQPDVPSEHLLVTKHDSGDAVQDLTPSDVFVFVKDVTAVVDTAASQSAKGAAGAPLPSPRCDVLGVTAVDGKFSVMFLANAGVERVHFGVNIAGNLFTVTSTARRNRVLCEGLGEFVKSYEVMPGSKYGLAVSEDQQYMVVTGYGTHRVAVYDLYAGGKNVALLGGPTAGTTALMFDKPAKVCFTPPTRAVPSFLVADSRNNRLQEITVRGEFVREIRSVKDVWSVACNDTLIVVGNYRGVLGVPAVEALDFVTGALHRVIAVFGGITGISTQCEGLRISPDGRHVLVSDFSASPEVTLYTVDGEFVAKYPVCALSSGNKDVEYLADGVMAVVEATRCRLAVVSADGQRLVRELGSDQRGKEPGQYQRPIALASRGQFLYVLNDTSTYVNVVQ